MSTLDIDWWCFVFCFLFSILTGCCRSHDQMPTSHCFAWQWASVAVSMTHCNYLRKVLDFFDFSVLSYHHSHIMSFQIENVACFYLLVLSWKLSTSHLEDNLNSFFPGMLLFFQVPLVHKIFWFYVVVVHSYPVVSNCCRGLFILEVRIEKFAMPYVLGLFSIQNYNQEHDSDFFKFSPEEMFLLIF